MRGRLRVGIAGLHRGQAFLEAIRWCEETELVAICDTSPAVLEQRGPMFGEVPRFTEYEQMLDCGLDLVVIATPAHVHVKQAVAALARDLHVFSEVPAATSLKQCVDLVEAARRSIDLAPIEWTLRYAALTMDSRSNSTGERYPSEECSRCRL